MKRIFISFVFILLGDTCIYAQSENIGVFCDLVTETVGSFFDNPNHHSNTVKVNDLLKSDLKTCDELFSLAWDNNKSDVPYINNTRKIIKVSNQLVEAVATEGQFYCNVTEMDKFLNPIFKAFNWQIIKICSCKDIEVYEYSKDLFKMIIVRNTRFESQSEYGDGNIVQYTCYHIDKFKKLSWFLARTIGGGRCQMIQYKDDQSPQKGYQIIKKITSKRLTQ
jgi:hypothetical protein